MNTNNTNNTNTTNNENVLPKFKTPGIFYPFIALIVFLIIVLMCFLFKVPNPFNSNMKSLNSTEQTVIADTFIIIFFVLLIVVGSISLLPNFTEVKELFEQISNVTYFIIYTIFLIILFTMMNQSTIDEYANIIMITTLSFGALMLYLSLKQNYVDDFNVNYERIKTMILLFCLITTFIMYYNTDPGGYIQKYFGYTLLLTIIIAVFGFLYLMVVLTLPGKSAQPKPGSKSNNFLDNFSNMSSYGSIGFLLFIIIITVIISTYPGGFFNDKATAVGGMIMILLICILWSILLVATQFPELSNVGVSEKMSFFKRSLLILFGIVISGLIIFWIVYNIQNLSGKSGTVSLVLNLLLVLVVLGLIYKTINVQMPAGNSKKNAFFSLLLNTLFYIPCLFSGAFDSIGKFTAGEYHASSMGSLLMLVFAVLLLVIYFTMPNIFNKINLQGGKQLVNKPVYTDSQYSLGTYQELNGSDNFDYQYAISCWVFIDAVPPNTSASYNKYTSLLNFGNKPNVLYNGTTNTLIVTIQQKDLNVVTNNKLIDFDESNNRILYRNKNMLLQKWNNIIINYNGGVLDIFLNGELVKSDIGVVPYYTIDNLTIGEDSGIRGGICNVVYFSRALNSANVYYLYNMVKNKSPPVLNESNETIIKQNLQTVDSSVNTVI